MENQEAKSNDAVIDPALYDGAEIFERFWLQPNRYCNQEIKVRLKLNKKFGGWKLKDDLIHSLNLKVGDCICTEVSVMLGPGIIDDDGDTDLFADGENAAWLVETVLHNGVKDTVVEGCTIDCIVKLVFGQAPVGPNYKSVSKITLVLVKGLGFVGYSEDKEKKTGMRDNIFSKLLSSM